MLLRLSGSDIPPLRRDVLHSFGLFTLIFRNVNKHFATCYGDVKVLTPSVTKSLDLRLDFVIDYDCLRDLRVSRTSYRSPPYSCFSSALYMCTVVPHPVNVRAAVAVYRDEYVVS